ncbi:MAG: pyridoxal phosphate-dependent aminotransferase, partial [Armatimonadetes bacterium]|nr:pyridoxal phosphate-dependent aminotransferase [Armatimonadota bacterium]
TLQLSTIAKQRQAQGIDVISFAVGEPDFPTPQHIVEAAEKAMAEGKTKYTPEAGIPELRAAVAESLQADTGIAYSPEQVVISNGGKHALMNVWQCILEPGDEVIVIAPYWVSYPPQIELCGATAKIVATTGDNAFQPDPEEVRALVSDKTAAILINSPSNPAGAVLERAVIEAMAEIAVEADCWIVSDEIYRCILFDGRQHFSPAMLGEEVAARTIIVDGVSKTYSMTGWRIGWLVGPEDLAKAASRLQGQQTSNPNSIAQWAALAALQGPQECVEQMRAEFERRRDYIVTRLAAIPGIKISNPGGAFYAFPDVSAYLDGSLSHEGQPVTDDWSLARYLLDAARISVVPGAEFGLPGYIRFSFATSMERIKEGLSRFEEALGS